MATHVVQSDSARPGELLNSLTLVSNSPQRAKLLREAGYRFQVVPPRLNEPQDISANRSAAQHAQALAYYKARSVADELPDRLLLGADTIVAVGDEILGKPAGRDDARRMLRRLTTTPHCVITGIALLAPALDRRLIADEVTHVTMTLVTDRQLESYLDSGAWQNKAGGYGLQAGGDAFVDHIDGSYSNVIGLPMELLARLIQLIAR